MANVKLYYTSTSCGAANFITASLGGVQIDSEQVDLATHKTQSGRDFYEINPKGNVPTLVFPDGSILNENVATLTYLADQGKAGLAPQEGTPDRYRYLNALSFVATELHKGVGALFNRTLSAEAKEPLKAVAGKKIDLLVGLLAGRKYLLGDNLSAADIYAYIVLTWTPYLGIVLSADAAAYKDRVGSLEGVQKAHAAMNAAATPAAKPQPKLALNYWNGRGLMEVPRAMLAISGKFPPADYSDNRHQAPPEGLTANLGRMPLLTVGDAAIGQSSAINFYVAHEAGLLGSNAVETAQILSIGAHLQELREAWYKLVPYGTEPTEEVLNKWFDDGAKDVTGTADRAGHSTRFLSWWAGRIEAVLGDQGFAVGNKLSLADVQLYNAFAEVLRVEEAPEGMPASKREPFTSKARTDALLVKLPKLSRSLAAVADNANFQKWLATRGKQGF